MTQRVLGPTGSRARATRTSLMMMALMGLVLGVLIGGGGFGSAAPGPGVADYSQCANDKAGSTANTVDPSDCVPKGWINGILNDQNSQYREDQVTAQRLFVDGLTAGEHTYDLRYLVRKADGHAYDSLATWNHTQQNANPCQGLNGPAAGACATAFSSADTLPIDLDTSFEVDSPCTNDATTSVHQLTGQVFTMGGGDLISMAYTGTSSDSEGLYRGVRITFETTGPAHRVYLWFGGHLAPGGNPPTSPRGWGTDCGASSINGGPYHIKLDLIDNASAGNRDNQIMSNAVLPLAESAIVTQPSASATFSATLDDLATVTGNNPTGNVTFRLFGPSATQPDCATATPIFVKTVALAPLNGSTTQSSASTTGTAVGSVTGSNTVTVAGTYWWTAAYPGDAQNVGATSACGAESTTITAPGITNTP